MNNYEFGPPRAEAIEQEWIEGYAMRYGDLCPACKYNVVEEDGDLCEACAEELESTDVSNPARRPS